MFQDPESHQGIQLQMIHTQNMDHLAFSWKSTQVYLYFGFQVGICIGLLKSQQWKKYVPLQSNFPQHPNFQKPNIQQQEIAPHKPFTTLVDLHKILLPIANFENKKVLFNLQSQA
jgi:hypothetical protein